MDKGKDNGQRVGKETEEESRKKERVEEEGAVVAMEEDVEGCGAEREIANEVSNYAMALQTELLEDLIREILVRLPAKPLCRFRSVCKTWRDMFGRPDFKDSLHRHKHITFILQNNYSGSCHEKLYSMVYEEGRETPGIQVQELRLPPLGFCRCSFYQISSHYRPLPRLKSSFDGLVLITVQHPPLTDDNDGTIASSAIILNPFTREMKRIPLKSYDEGGEVWGIGYDHLNRCYKVVRAPSHGRYSPVQVLSLRTNSWRTTITGFLYEITPRNPVTANRSSHWIASNRNTRQHHIIYFDASEEDFRIVPPPPTQAAKNRGVLVGVGENLGLCMIDHEEKEKDVISLWWMKEHGRGESWAKL
ncbi:hypothetical protein Tsubulata_013134 [Turnera subulata]|uniref:F-box domain-containing protein n=1 Tax=Turnera subulata TaxID=218843 RepID=A0A9Q0J6Z3_9ROSI|nr:hypothetical protein Tsubulata_013134 [Turnera subulata]